MPERPLESDFINIHTHFKPKSGEWVLRNAFHCLSPESIQTMNYAVSVGVHPWHVEKVNWDAFYFRLNESLKLPNVLAVGEIGLDRAIQTPIEIQQKYFESQLVFANRFNKPVIIHAVRTYTEFVPYLKESSVPFIFHHFAGNEQELLQLMKHNTYFSFGKLLFTATKMIDIFKNIPINRLFLETDTAPISIQQVYEKAAELKNMKVIDLKENVFHNFAAVFRTSTLK
ncbi:TatD family hydrolase [Solitalea sp. MAHUQ-68]|uniref:TatD family hydrolase n=1 Tax=Solitalea agri TaxID=2953739 RepID=A0A9X2F5K5_9SPHI|nr:TatD family hydrolase [Solitalea agri]MCO4294589.1 TatD family hydrolase [Solitalea agri]